MSRYFRPLLILTACLWFSGVAVTKPAGKLVLPANTGQILEHIYSGRGDLALPEIRQLEQQAPEDPLGYLLEAEVEWWQIWCDSAEFKYGMTMARHHEKAPGDQHYLELTTKAYTLAENSLRQQHRSGEMHLYAAMADALAARLYAMRGEYRAAARAGVRARSNFQQALELDPTLDDAYTGLGLYNYYVDTLSMLAKAMRFLMGIPGGSKEEGIRQLEWGMEHGQLGAQVARFYLAMNLLNYDQKYEEALRVITPLAEKYPGNPLFQLMRGDLNAKLGRKQLAETDYHAAETAANAVPEPDCRAKMKQLARQSLEALERKH
jgi:predicted negative regulator of RcsB-dependent stress response